MGRRRLLRRSCTCRIPGCICGGSYWYRWRRLRRGSSTHRGRKQLPSWQQARPTGATCENFDTRLGRACAARFSEIPEAGKSKMSGMSLLVLAMSGFVALPGGEEVGRCRHSPPDEACHESIFTHSPFGTCSAERHGATSRPRQRKTSGSAGGQRPQSEACAVLRCGLPQSVKRRELGGTEDGSRWQGGEAIGARSLFNCHAQASGARREAIFVESGSANQWCRAAHRSHER